MGMVFLNDKILKTTVVLFQLHAVSYSVPVHVPSLRSLCRALAIARDNPCGNVLRSLFEAFSLAFLTQLDRESQEAVEKCVVRDILTQKNVKPILGRGLPQPPAPERSVQVEGYWITVGTFLASENKKRLVSCDFV
jgi:midasin (ATPase involved in ribosome maturation)